MEIINLTNKQNMNVMINNFNLINNVQINVDQIIFKIKY